MGTCTIRCPPGHFSGASLFLLLINDLPSSVSSSVKLFADDSVLYRHIESSADHDKLQQDLFQLEEWAAMWQMNFAPSKCYIMSITLKRQPSSFSYTLCNTPLEGVTFQKYLGVYITNSLNWTKQAVEVKKKANKILGVLQRNLSSCSVVVRERAYLSLVRPVCEYSSVAWSPYTQKDIICVESVQRRAARFVCNDYCRSSSVNTMLSNLGWQGLETRRKITDLTIFFETKTGNVRISFPNDLREVHCPYLTRGSAQHPFQFQRYSSTISAHKYSFFVRTVPAWNPLSLVSVRPDSVAVFHSSICNNAMFWRFLFYLFIFFFRMTCNFICIYLVICFNFVYLSRCQFNVMGFRVLTVHWHITSLEAITSIND